VAIQQTVVNPNDVSTATASVYKQLNRGFIELGGTLQSTIYENDSLQNYDRKTFDGSGGIWLTPLLYAYGDGIQSFSEPEIGANSNYFRARGGIGTALIGPFQGAVYYGQQGAEVTEGGNAGGDIYGGVVSFYPSLQWNMSFSVDRLRNISNITSGAPQALGGLAFVGVGVSPSESVQTTALTFKSNYTFSPQTSGYIVLSDTLIDYLRGPPMLDQSWLASIGLQHQLRQNLNLTLSYQFIRYLAEAPNTSFKTNLVTLGAVYNF
jgi:hypothetical protein